MFFGLVHEGMGYDKLIGYNLNYTLTIYIVKNL